MKIFKTVFLIIGVLFLTLVAIGIFKREFSSQASISINAPVDRVFAVYNNPFLLHHWLDNFHSIENISGQPNQVGSKWRLHFKDQEGDLATVDETLIDYQANKLIAFDYSNQWLDGKHQAIFEPDTKAQTRITIQQNYSGKGIVQNAMLFLMGHHIDESNQKNLQQLKVLIEQAQADNLH